MTEAVFIQKYRKFDGNYIMRNGEIKSGSVVPYFPHEDFSAFYFVPRHNMKAFKEHEANKNWDKMEKLCESIQLSDIDSVEIIKK